MKNLQNYLSIKLEKNPLELKSDATVEREFKRVTGPRAIYGKVSITVSPSPEFEFFSSANWPSENYDNAVLEAILDIFLCQSYRPLLGVKVVLNAISWHEIDSCYLGYYMAAKHVAEKVLEDNDVGY